MTTLAGTGKAGFANGACDKAQFEGPNGLVCISDSLIYVADTDGHRIRSIDRKTSTVTTLAGREKGHKDGFGEEAQFDSPWGMVHHEGKLYVSQDNHCLRCIVISTSERFCAQSPIVVLQELCRRLRESLVRRDTMTVQATWRSLTVLLA